MEEGLLATPGSITMYPRSSWAVVTGSNWAQPARESALNVRSNDLIRGSPYNYARLRRRAASEHGTNVSDHLRCRSNHRSKPPPHSVGFAPESGGGRLHGDHALGVSAHQSHRALGREHARELQRSELAPFSPLDADDIGSSQYDAVRPGPRKRILPKYGVYMVCYGCSWLHDRSLPNQQGRYALYPRGGGILYGVLLMRR